MDSEQLVGTDFDGYSIESVLGRGAMGVVYVARQHSPERRVALKLITPAFAGDEVFRERFLREATAAAAIEHPNILPVYAAGESDNILFIAARLIDGADLGKILRASPELPLDRIAQMVGQIGGALDAAHARGLIHRDVKPANILVARPTEEEDHLFYLTDFGVSKWTTSSAAAITMTGQLIGTANYVAPEQIEGKPVDGRTDLYALGCVLHECLTGRAPFSGRGPAATLYAHLHEEAPPPSSIRPDLPPGLDVVVSRALRKSPQERYASCRELTKDLRAALAAPSLAPPGMRPAAAPRGSATSTSRGRGTRVGLAIVATGLIVAISVIAFVVHRDSGVSQAASPSVTLPPLIRDGVQVIASETAPTSTDAAGSPISYVPSNVIDGDVQTAWRTPGDGHGVTVTLIFDNPIDVVRIGLIPGYAKTDPLTGANRFLQGRIIESVTYQVAGLPKTTQTFKPLPVPQFVRLRATTSRITVRILKTSPPGGLDYTAISEIYVYAYPQ